MKSWLQNLDPQIHLEKSRQATSHLIFHSLWKESQTILLYVALSWELETKFLIQHAWEIGKTIVLPQVSGEHLLLHKVASEQELKLGSFNIHEPDGSVCEQILLKEIDLMIVPGMAFDSTGRRLGKGKGYYDRLLAAPERRARAGGLFFSEQEVPLLLHEDHDVELDFIVTEKGFLDFSKEK